MATFDDDPSSDIVTYWCQCRCTETFQIIMLMHWYRKYLQVRDSWGCLLFLIGKKKNHVSLSNDSLSPAGWPGQWPLLRSFHGCYESAIFHFQTLHFAKIIRPYRVEDLDFKVTAMLNNHMTGWVRTFDVVLYSQPCQFTPVKLTFWIKKKVKWALLTHTKKCESM